MTSLKHSPVNDQRRNDFFNKVRELGRDSGSGIAARVKAAHTVIAAAADGIITDADAKEISESYAASESGRNMVEYKTIASAQANASKFKQIIKAGAMAAAGGYNQGEYTFDTPEMLQRAGDLIKARVERGDKMNASAFEKLVKICREQIKVVDHVLDNDEIDAFLAPEEKADPDELDRLETLINTMKRVHDGKKDTGEGALPSPQLEAAINKVRDRIDELTHESKMAALMKASEEMGVTIVVPETRTPTEPHVQEDNSRIFATAALLGWETVEGGTTPVGHEENMTDEELLDALYADEQQDEAAE